MVVDITPSLAAGEIEQKMYENICSHYSIGQKDVETVLEKNYTKYCCINRSNPNVLNRTDLGQYVQSIHTNCKNYSGGFKYQDDTYMNHFCVSNPENAGAVGIEIIQTNEARTLIASGSLSGCGFAVLFRCNQVFVIHAGGSNDTKSDLPAEQRRELINRDIFLMANALSGPEQYAGVQKNGGGMTCQQLFESINEQEFYGFIYVAKGTELCISDCDVQNLVLRSYTTALYHDVVCVMDECGNVSSALRTIDFYKIHAVHQHQLYKKQDRCVIV